MEASQKRERLVRFTGSDEVRVNDRRYMDMLCDKMRKETDSKMRKDEERRAEAERQRLRRLLAQGVISMEDMEEDNALYHEMKQKEQHRRGRKNNKRGASTKRPRTQPSPSRKPPPSPRSLKPSYSPPPRAQSSGNNTKRNRSSDNNKQRSDSEVESQMSRMDDDNAEGDDVNGGKGENEGDVTQQNGEEEIREEGQDGDNQNDTADDVDGGQNSNNEKKPLFERYEDPRVQQMRDEESVDALYRIADELIIPSKPKAKPKTQAVT